jgi:hypothetical protein
VALLFALGCERPAQTPDDGYVPPPAPKPLGLAPGAAIDRNKIIEVGRSQHYDENPGSSDESILDDGVRAIIEPEEGVWRLDSTALKQGVVVGRFRNRSDLPLARLGLFPGGTTYWFISQGEKGLTSAFIADTTVAGYDVTGIATMIHKPSRPWRQAVAQWQLPDVLRKEMGLGALGTLGVDKESGPWIACVTLGCCKLIN